MYGGAFGYPPAAQGMYGGAGVDIFGNGKPQGFFRRRRMNIVAIFLSLFAPWLLFCLTYAAMSFSWHFNHPLVTYLIETIGFIIVAVVAYSAMVAVVSASRGEAGRPGDAFWMVFLAITMALAWIAAVSIGSWNYSNHLEKYYDLKGLNAYNSVDPAKGRGEQYMDASQIHFAAGAKVDVSKAMSFKNHELYCAAPIITGDVPLATYDFWAVGKGCCDGSFMCGAAQDSKAAGGLRITDDEARPFYRLAVQQAESKHALKATHPLFFHFTRDPDSDIEDFRDDGLKFFVLGMFGHFVVQLLLVALASMAVTKL
eukprot:gnl/TRDRNA2_/TRDRNA2_181301_c0_seq1.p1 gnl/TRDRNA2_/TRDRNA2_181301_c0~~gnl/TRDRNA2_/TRDRNA2_181301_c0_seq1.p1  ORF type:complete len:313 (+),score=55.96 gnl/TRDRNA2_/TRDRNA2_181301_c0_seq1:75-1013(+)